MQNSLEGMFYSVPQNVLKCLCGNGHCDITSLLSSSTLTPQTCCIVIVKNKLLSNTRKKNQPLHPPPHSVLWLGLNVSPSFLARTPGLKSNMNYLTLRGWGCIKV
uniref:Uncharacterized protein n=1 Tax=Sphaerodactylus townsendi TaxID=933632 RepID=A0ACB8GE61_9SAUR